MIEWTLQAVRQLDQVHDYIKQANNEGVADRVRWRIIESVERLEAYPMLGRIGRVEGSRELVISDLPFIIAYKKSEKRLVILAIYHAARKWPDAF